MAIGAIGREQGLVAPATNDLSAASAADLRLLRGAFRASGIDLATGDIAYARSTITTLDAEVGLRGGQVVQPYRRADSALVIQMERHADSGANVNARVVDLASGKVTAETRNVQLRPRAPYETSEDIEGQFLALTQALGSLQSKRAVLADSPENDRTEALRMVPTSHRDVILQAQAAASAELNLRGLTDVGIRDLGENRRIEEELERAGKGKGKDKDKDKDKDRGKVNGNGKVSGNGAVSGNGKGNGNGNAGGVGTFNGNGQRNNEVESGNGKGKNVDTSA